MRVRYVAALLSALVLAGSLAGCETKRVTESMKDVEQTTNRADDLIKSLRSQTGGTGKSVSFTDEQWVNTRPIVVKRGLPASRDCELGYNETKSLQQFAQWLSDTCKTPVRVMPDALDGGASYFKGKGGSQASVSGPPAVIPTDSISDLFPGAVGGSYSSRPTSSYGGATRFAVANKYQGKLSGLLDTVTGSLGLSWRYEPDADEPATGVIKIYYLETRQFPIYAFNKSSTFQSEVKSGMSSSAGVSSSGAGQGGAGSTGISGESGSNQTTQVNMVSQLLDDIEKTVKSMLTLDHMSFSRTTGMLSVTDRPDVLDRVQEYLDGENERITKNVLLNVTVVSVNLSDLYQYGIDWSLVYKSVNGDWGFGLSNTFAGVGTGAISSSVSILDTSSSPWAGSKAVIKALSQQGRISSIRTPSVTTLNLQAAPLQIGKVKGYLQSSQAVSTANVGTTTSLMPGSITSGFNMSVVPMVMPAKQLLMQLMINMTGDPTFVTETAGDSKIQNPSYDAQILNQAVKLRSGQTLVISGFDQTVTNASKSGAFAPWNFLFGGGGLSEKTRDVLVLMITPIVME